MSLVDVVYPNWPFFGMIQTPLHMSCYRCRTPIGCFLECSEFSLAKRTVQLETTLVLPDFQKGLWTPEHHPCAIGICMGVGLVRVLEQTLWVV